MATSSTSFTSGTSGNPRGRPRGTAATADRLLAKAELKLLKLMIDAALNGDDEARKFILARIAERKVSAHAD